MIRSFLTTILTAVLVMYTCAVYASMSIDPYKSVVVGSRVEIPVRLKPDVNSAKFAKIKGHVHTLMAEFKYTKHPFTEEELAFWIQAASDLYGVQPELLLSKAAIESSLNPRAVSSKGATGLMGVMPKIHGYSKRELLDYRNSIMASAQVVSEYRQTCGRWRCAVEAYNIGITAYKSGNRNPRYMAKIDTRMRKMGVRLR